MPKNKKNNSNLCSVCSTPLPEDPDKYRYESTGKGIHVGCFMAASGLKDDIEEILRRYDNGDSETALADFIGDLGHYTDLVNREAEEGQQRIDFANACRRGLNYYHEERG